MKKAYYFLDPGEEQAKREENHLYKELFLLLQKHYPGSESLGDKKEFQQLHDLWILLRHGQIHVSRLLTEPEELLILEIHEDDEPLNKRLSELIV